MRRQDSICFSLLLFVALRAIASSLAPEASAAEAAYFCARVGGNASEERFVSMLLELLSSAVSMLLLGSGAYCMLDCDISRVAGLSSLLLGIEVFAQELDAPCLHDDHLQDKKPQYKLQNSCFALISAPSMRSWSRASLARSSIRAICSSSPLRIAMRFSCSLSCTELVKVLHRQNSRKPSAAPSPSESAAAC